MGVRDLSRRVLATTLSALIGAAGVLVAAGAVAQQSGAFTSAERHQLISGELVARPLTRTRGQRLHYVGGTSFQRIPESQERVWAIVNDLTEYRHLLPGAAEARQVSDRADERVVYIRHQYAFVSIGYHLIATVQPETHTIRFHLDGSRSNDIEAMHGYIRVDSFRDDESMVTWGVRGGSSNAFLINVFRPVMDDWSLLLPSCLRARAAGGSDCG